MLPEALAGGLFFIPPPKERAGTWVAGQECPSSAQGAPGASSAHLPQPCAPCTLDHTLQVSCLSQGTQPHMQGMDPEQGHSSQLCGAAPSSFCPLIHEHQRCHLVSEGQTEMSVEITKTSLLIPTLIYFLLLEARLFYFREH